jgi:hypothetical protein
MTSNYDALTSALLRLQFSGQSHPPGCDAACSLPFLFRQVLRRRADADSAARYQRRAWLPEPGYEPGALRQFHPHRQRQRHDNGGSHEPAFLRL